MLINLNLFEPLFAGQHTLFFFASHLSEANQGFKTLALPRRALCNKIVSHALSLNIPEITGKCNTNVCTDVNCNNRSPPFSKGLNEFTRSLPK